MTADLNLSWIDLETTGSDEHAGSLLEVGIIITDPDLRELARATTLVEPDPAHLDAMIPEVVEIHRTSGLLADLEAAEPHERPHPMHVDSMTRNLLDRYAIRGQVILAGSGVGHFDSRWIRAHLPRTARRLTYWSWDVGVVRRFLGSVDPDLVLAQYPDGGKPHRALADAELHLAEWRAYRDAMREAAPAFRVALSRNTAPSCLRTTPARGTLQTYRREQPGGTEMETAATIVAKANHYSTVAHDTWKLGAITSTMFAEITDLCVAATNEVRDYYDIAAAAQMIDEAAQLLDFAS